MVDGLMIGVGCLVLAYGLVGLVAARFAPRLFSTRLYGSAMLTGRMAPTSGNRALMSAWALFFGGWCATSFVGYRPISHVFAAAFVLTAVTALYVRQRHGRDA